LVSTKPHAHSVGTCYKCNTIIEPLLSEQWYVAVNKKGEKSGKIFAKDALEAVKSGRVEFVSERFKKSCIQWLENIRDWNISRQIVWGIQIPVWTRGEETFAGTEAPEGEGWTQETDVFDTWFSSGQWPFATLKNSKTPGDFDKFYPTSVMETGYDIIFFWVIRMIMFGLYINDEVPFKNVYMHGIVRDKNNQKMSKSKGNVVNPLELANLYGTDAVRTALVFGTSAGADSCISEEKIKGYRNFSNKIWNASRFVMLQVTNGDLKTGDIGETKLDNLDIDETILTNADKAILKDLADVKTSVTKKMTEYRFSQAGEELYEYFWHTFCDIYIEAAKGQLGAAPLSVIPSEAGIQADELVAINTKKILIKVLTETLIMLHPFIPFVTEAVWQELLNIFPQLPKSIMIAKWPE
jgi:valyl-tRNA synthetase